MFSYRMKLLKCFQLYHQWQKYSSLYWNNQHFNFPMLVLPMEHSMDTKSRCDNGHKV